MLSVKKTDSRNLSLLDAGLYAICGGVAVSILFPPFAMYANAMTALGGYSLFYYATTWSKFDKVFKALGLNKGSSCPILKYKKRTENSIIYHFTLPGGLGVDDFIKCKPEIEQFIGKEIEIKYTYKEIIIEVYLRELKTEYKYEIIDCKGPVEFPIGYNRKGEIVKCDLSKGEPHMLVAGETGSGKSTTLRSITTNIILTKPKLKLHLIDLKCGAEFQIFEHCRNVKSFSTTKEEAEKTLNNILSEVYRRYKMFRQNDCADIKEYNSKHEPIDYVLIIIDEFADLQHEKGSISILEELAAKARACGIHLIISSQRPDRYILNGRIKANVTTILGLKTTNRANSEIVIDKSRLEFLRGKGHAIFKKGYEVELQCPLLSTDEARELLKPTYIKREVPKEDIVLDFSFLENL